MKFNLRVQGQDEPVENFIIVLYRLAAAFWEYGSLKQNRLVVDLMNNNFSEKLQMN